MKTGVSCSWLLLCQIVRAYEYSAMHVDRGLAFSGAIQLILGLLSGFTLAIPLAVKSAGVQAHNIGALQGTLLLVTSVIWPHFTNTNDSWGRVNNRLTAIFLIVGLFSNWFGVQVAVVFGLKTHLQYI